MRRYVVLALALLIAGTGTPRAATEAQAAGTVTGDYLIAQAAEYDGDWKTAASLMTSVWQRSQDPAIARQAFLISLGAGEISQALALSPNLGKDMPESGISTALLAADALKRNDMTEAARLIGALPDRGVSVPLKTILGAWLDAGHGDRTAAVKRLNGLKQFDAYRDLHIAMIDEFAGDRNKADAGYAALAKGEPMPRIVSFVAAYYRRTGRPALAEAAIAALPAKGNIAAVSVRAGRAVPPPRPTTASGAGEAFYDMAELLLEADHPDIALFYAAIAAHLDPAKSETHLLLGEIEQAQGRHDQAAADFLAVPEKADFGLLSRLDAARAFEQAGHADKAIAAATALARACPALPEPQMALGDTLRRHDQNDKAIGVYGHALSLIGKDDPMRAEVTFARAIAYDRLHNDAAAEADLKQAAALAPDRPTILNYLGFFWTSRDENLEQAHAMLNQAYRLAPTDGAIADSLGWVFYQQGDYANALTYLEQAVALRPGDSEINAHLGDAYWQVGRPNDARFQWRHALLNATSSDVKTLEGKLRDGLPAARPGTPKENHAALEAKPEVP